MTPIPGKIIQGDFSLHYLYPSKAVVRDKQVAVQVGRMPQLQFIREKSLLFCMFSKLW